MVCVWQETAWGASAWPEPGTTSQPEIVQNCRCERETPSRSYQRKATMAGGRERCTAGWGTNTTHTHTHNRMCVSLRGGLTYMTAVPAGGLLSSQLRGRGLLRILLMWCGSTEMKSPTLVCVCVCVLFVLQWVSVMWIKGVFILLMSSLVKLQELNWSPNDLDVFTFGSSHLLNI